MQIRLLVACREEQVALALCTQIAQASGGCIAAEAVELVKVVQKTAVARPDVLMLECAREGDAGVWGTRLTRLRQVSESTRLLMLCKSNTHHMVIAFIQHGASGCLLQSSEPSLYVKAVRTVHEGETWFGRAELLQALRIQMIAEPTVASSVLDYELLTAREREVMAFIGSALTNKEIARQLKISDKTVKTHLHHIYVKLQKSGRYKAFLSNVFSQTSLRSASPGGLPQGGFTGK